VSCILLALEATNLDPLEAEGDLAFLAALGALAVVATGVATEIITGTATGTATGAVTAPAPAKVGTVVPGEIVIGIALGWIKVRSAPPGPLGLPLFFGPLVGAGGRLGALIAVTLSRSAKLLTSPVCTLWSAVTNCV